MLLRKTLPLSIILVMGLTTEGPALAAGCLNGHPTVEQEFRQARYVAVGTIREVKKNVPVRLRYKNGSYKSRVMIQTLTIQKQYKGPARRSITYSDEYSSAQFPMTIGKKYLLFYKQRDDGSLYIDVCGNSQEITKMNAAVIEKIENLSTRPKLRAHNI